MASRQHCHVFPCHPSSISSLARYHKVGEVPHEDASVIIAIGSVHRLDGLEAVHFAIDELKANGLRRYIPATTSLQFQFGRKNFMKMVLFGRGMQSADTNIESTPSNTPTEL